MAFFYLLSLRHHGIPRSSLLLKACGLSCTSPYDADPCRRSNRSLQSISTDSRMRVSDPAGYVRMPCSRIMRRKTFGEQPHIAAACGMLRPRSLFIVIVRGDVW